MAYSITVDTDKLRNTSRAVRQYIQSHRSNMNSLNNSILSVTQQQVGSEFDVYRAKWQAAYGNTSSSEKMLKCMESYADYLDSCVYNYEVAQSNARIRASRI